MSLRDLAASPRGGDRLQGHRPASKSHTFNLQAPDSGRSGRFRAPGRLFRPEFLQKGSALVDSVLGLHFPRLQFETLDPGGQIGDIHILLGATRLAGSLRHIFFGQLHSLYLETPL